MPKDKTAPTDRVSLVYRIDPYAVVSLKLA
jgi:hypothetical protein